MAEIIKLLYTIITAVSVALSSFLFPVKLEPSLGSTPEFLEYPDGYAITLEQAGLTVEGITSRLDASLAEYEQSKGYSDINGVFISPFYTAKVNGKDIPVYASLVFNRSKDSGDIHSFSEVYVNENEDFSFNIELTGTGSKLRNAIVLPSKYGVKTLCKNGKVSASINKTGIYTFLFNGAGQNYGYTLFVRDKTDDEERISRLVSEYGEENVKVFEKGIHELDYLNFVEKNNTVIYLKRGACLVAKHSFDIKSAEDELKFTDDGAWNDNNVGLTRYPFMNFFRCKNVIIEGNGVVDLVHLDRRERRGVVFCSCEGVTVKGIKIVNSPEWSFITYCSNDVSVLDTDIFGCRGNADGFAICNTHNAVIKNCFARTADDGFEVKALGGTQGSDNITFSECIAWGGYARCFGICGEVDNPITNVFFRNCAVIYRDGVWDNDRIGSLVVVAENCGGSINNVVFENIEVFRDEGRAILVKIYDAEKEGFEIKNVVFRNIRYTSYMLSKVEGNGKNNTVDVTFENVTSNGINANLFRRFIFGW